MDLSWPPLARFDEIQWDQEVSQAFRADEFQQCHGEPFLPVRPRSGPLNPVFLAEMLLSHFDLVYDRDTFRRFDPGTRTWTTILRPEIFRLVTKRLIRLAHDFPSQFPPSGVRRPTVNQLVWLMETQGYTEIPTAQEAVERFFTEAVESRAGAELTQAAFYEGLDAFCKGRRWTLCSRAFFDKAATRRFGETSHCFGENRTSRGRKGWQLRIEVISKPSDGQTPTPHA